MPKVESETIIKCDYCASVMIEKTNKYLCVQGYVRFFTWQHYTTTATRNIQTLATAKEGSELYFCDLDCFHSYLEKSLKDK